MDKQFVGELKVQRMSLGNFNLCIIFDLFLCSLKRRWDDGMVGQTSLVKDGEKSPSGIAAIFKLCRS